MAVTKSDVERYIKSVERILTSAHEVNHSIFVEVTQSHIVST